MSVRRPFHATISLAAAALLTAVSPAAAQRATGPYSGLLGETPETPTRQTLEIRASVYGAWDHVLSSVDESALNDQFLQGGFAGGASGALIHARRSSRLQWNSSAATSVRMYRRGNDTTAATFSGSTGIDSQLSRRLRLSTSGGFTYSPYYDFSPSLDDRFIPAGALTGGYGVATAAQRNITADGDARLNIRLSRRDTVDVGANARRYEFLDQADSSITSYGGQATFRHALTRALGIRAGFIRQQGLYAFAGSSDATTDTFDVGIDYGDTLAFSRRTALSFSSATSAVRWEGETHYRIDGNASLTRAFSRNGSMAVRYTRDTSFSPGFREPLLNDSVTGSISNQLGRQISWSASAGYTRGKIGFTSESPSASNHYNTFSAGGRLTRGFTRYLGIFGDYSFYRYDVPAGSTVLTTLSQFSRHSVSVGLTAWVPLISDRRAVASAANNLSRTP